MPRYYENKARSKKRSALNLFDPPKSGSEVPHIVEKDYSEGHEIWGLSNGTYMISDWAEVYPSKGKAFKAIDDYYESRNPYAKKK